ncbi:DNA phosphorothioation system sulfurtransferase DndC [Leptolyngbya ohadii]|uniref:DNA phosphorothioation system sulfurtransferase DndC n=1 Tax=Leptolyngbya ohadii TaxID=1962290 RepID=UPI000B59DEC6|nr:DNA phosphorothioation system sulfurtransferase DndC [Leptolyngbya ohadii]
MTEAVELESSQRSVPEFVETLKALTTEIQELYCQDQLPWIVGYSGGKDSTAILQLVWDAIAALPVEKRKKTIHVITTDTMVENPVVSAWVSRSLEQMGRVAQEQGIPIEPILLKPAVKDSFWVNLIGKGYPAPRQGFRWCTERLKIRPSDNYIREKIRESGEVILVLGTRKAESASRAALMEKHRNWRVFSHLNYNPSRPNSLIYTPIEDWRTDEVWLYLMQWQNPWGNNNKELFAMYRGATADNECPLVVDTSTPSCGSSRFGCWVCTLVSADKSMEAMIQNDEEKEWMQPLLDLRNELDVEDDLDRRDFRRRQGQIQLYERDVEGLDAKEIVNIPGPYTKQWREEWLRRVLQTQTEARQNAPIEMQGIELITVEELSEIRRIWLEEFHEFDDALPRIYSQVTGQDFIDPRPNAGSTYLGLDEWSILEEICDDPMHFELMTRLLSTERKFQTMSRRVGIIDALEKHFETSSRPKEAAIENAHRNWNIKKAAKAGDVEAVKQLTDQPAVSWADMKFKGRG